MQIRLLSVAQVPSLGRKPVLIACMFLMAILPSGAVFADGPFQRLRKGFDAIRPGWIIPHATEEDEKSSSKEKQESASKKKPAKSASKKREPAASAKEKTPTLAPTPAELDDNAAIAPVPADTNELHAESIEKDSNLLHSMAISAPDEFGAKAEFMEETKSLVIVGVDENGAARAAGLAVGDVIKSVGGVDISSEASLEGITSSLDQGVVVDFEIVRDGEELNKPVQFGTFSPGEVSPSEVSPQVITTPAVSPQPQTPHAVKATHKPLPAIAPTPVSTREQVVEIPKFKSVLGARSVDSAQPASSNSVEPLSSLLELSTPALEKSATPEPSDDSFDGLLDLD